MCDGRGVGEVRRVGVDGLEGLEVGVVVCGWIFVLFDDGWSMKDGVLRGGGGHHLLVGGKGGQRFRLMEGVEGVLILLWEGKRG